MSENLVPICTTSDSDFDQRLDQRLAWDAQTDRQVEDAARDIIADVRKQGDAAVLDYTRRFDNWQPATAAELQVTGAEIEAARQRVDSESLAALETAAQRVRAYHERQKTGSWQYEEADGTVLGQQVTPLDRVGIYVPGGKASYPSSVLMNAIPAKVAGVGEIVMTVPTPAGERNDMVLAAAGIAGSTGWSPSAVPRPLPRWPTAPKPCRGWTRSSVRAISMSPPPSGWCLARWAWT